MKDNRSEKTKKILQKTLANLMLNQELHTITIKQLTEGANMHRATFYLHYADIYDLYNQMEDGVIEGLNSIIFNSQTKPYDQVFSEVMGYIFENKEICKMLLSKNAKSSYNKRMYNILEEIYFKEWQIETKTSSIDDNWKFLAKYHIDGSLGIIKMWAEEDFMFSSEKIAQLIYTLDDTFNINLYK